MRRAHDDLLSRSRILALILAFILIAVIGRLTMMILLNGDSYTSTASGKASKTIRLYGQRGTIYDTNMTPLAYDQSSYNVTFYRDPSKSDEAARKAYTETLLTVIDIVESNARSTVNDLWLKKDEFGVWHFDSGSGLVSTENTRRSQWSANFYLTKYPEEEWFDLLCEKYVLPKELSEEKKIQVLSLWQESRMNNFNSTPVVIAYDVGFETVAQIEAKMDTLDGIDITESSTRVYPQGTTACHIIGYISKISSANLEAYQKMGYPNDAFVGSDGIESSLESELSPYIEYRQGSRVVERNTRGKVVRELTYEAPQDGNDVILTIDVNLQDVMSEALEDAIEEIHDLQEETMARGHWQRANEDILAEYEENDWDISLAESGAMIAMDPNTGRVLGMVSYPDFDLSWFNSGMISMSHWNEIQAANDALYNRAISTKDSPGSIFKLCTALAGLSEGAITLDTRIDDEGGFYKTDSSHPAKCWTSTPEDHQNQTVVEGLTHSCNYFFYETGYRTGEKNIYKWAAQLGMTSKTNVELPGETTSFVGNQEMLYNPELSVSGQKTHKPELADTAIRGLLTSIAQERGMEWSDELIDECVNKLLSIAVSYESKSEWQRPIREVLQYDLGLPVSYISSHYLGNTITTYIQELYWTPNETIMLAIGQSITQISPIAAARYVCAIANGGYVYDAQIVDKIISPDGAVVLEKQPVVANKIDTDPAYFQAIQRGMEGVTSGEDGGTAAKYYAEWEGIIAAKTGTSQRTELDIENNAWQVAFAPIGDPKIVVVCYVQNGYAGANLSGAIIDTISYYLNSLEVKENTSVPKEFSIAD